MEGKVYYYQILDMVVRKQTNHELIVGSCLNECYKGSIIPDPVVQRTKARYHSIVMKACKSGLLMYENIWLQHAKFMH